MAFSANNCFFSSAWTKTWYVKTQSDYGRNVINAVQFALFLISINLNFVVSYGFPWKLFCVWAWFFNNNFGQGRMLLYQLYLILFTHLTFRTDQIIAIFYQKSTREQKPRLHWVQVERTNRRFAIDCFKWYQ